MSRSTRRYLMAGFIALAVAVFVTLTLLVVVFKQNTDRISSNQNSLARVERTQSLAIYGACHRLNLVRASENLSQLSDFRFFILTEQLIAGNLTHPITPQNPKQIKQTRLYLAKLHQNIAAKLWIPLTNCRYAVTDPLTFHASDAIRFVDKVPPHKDLVVGPGE